LPHITYGYEIWSLILWADYSLMVHGNRLPTIFRAKREEETRQRRKVHDEELKFFF